MSEGIIFEPVLYLNTCYIEIFANSDLEITGYLCSSKGKQKKK